MPTITLPPHGVGDAQKLCSAKKRHYIVKYGANVLKIRQQCVKATLSTSLRSADEQSASETA